jgi:hypothetical protein
MVNGGAHSEAVSQALTAWPLAYMAACCYYSLFRLGMFSFYHVVPRATNAHSLLMNAAQVRARTHAGMHACMHARALDPWVQFAAQPCLGRALLTPCTFNSVLAMLHACKGCLLVWCHAAGSPRGVTCAAAAAACKQVTRFAAPLAYNYLHVIRMHEYLGEERVSAACPLA